MSSRFALIALACLTIVPTLAAADEFPYTGYIQRDDVQARSGPGRNYYATGSLYEGDEVEVYRHDPGGWCAVRPPRGSFSWVLADDVRLVDGQTAEVQSDGVVARVGTEQSDTRDVIQVRLNRGERVTVLEAQQFGRGPEAVTWYRIAPPAGEFRWVSQESIDRHPPHRSERPARDERGDDELRSGETRDDADEHDEAESTEPTPAVEEHEDEESHDSRDEDESADRDLDDEEEYEEPAPDEQVEQDGEPEASANRRREAPERSRRRQRDDAEAYDEEYDERYDDDERDRPRRDAERLDDDRDDEDYGDDEYDRERYDDDYDDRRYRDEDEYLDDDQVRQAQYLTPSDRSRTRRSEMRAKTESRRLAAREFRQEEELRRRPPSGARHPYDSPEVDIAGDHESAELAPHAALEDIDLALAEMVTDEPDIWRLAPLKLRAEELLATSQTAVERGRARLLLGRIERFEDIERRYRALSSTQEHLARRRDQLDRVRDDGDAPRETELGGARFDGTGRLAQIDSNRPNGPSYALVDSVGRVRSYVTPAPGVNLRHYLGRTVGVTGTQGYMPELNRHHVTARRVTVLDNRVIY